MAGRGQVGADFRPHGATRPGSPPAQQPGNGKSSLHRASRLLLPFMIIILTNFDESRKCS